MRGARLVICLVACSGSSAAPGAGSGSSGSAAPPAAAACAVDKPVLGAGLGHERWPLGAGCIDVVRGDLSRYHLRVLGGTGAAKPAPAWRSDNKLVAVTNAGMFHASGAPVGLIVDRGTARGNDNHKMSGYLAWDPVAAGDAPAIVAGRDCAGFDLADLRKRYRSLVQSYRLLGCDGAALPWSDAKRYSAAAIGVDRHGAAVFLHARGAATMTELAAAIAGHDLAGALFLEGGPEASLVVRGTDGELSVMGSYETGFTENDDNHEFWALPNVIGLE